MTRLFLAGIGVLLAVHAVVWTRLPEPMASHWNLAGMPDGTMPRLANLVIAIGLLTLGWAIARVTPAPLRVAFMGAWLGYVLLLQVWVLVANLGADSWEDAVLPAPWLLFALVVGGIITLGIAWWRATPTPEPIGTAPVVAEPGVDSGLEWSGSSRSSVLVVASLAVALMALLLPAWIPFLLLAIALVLHAFSSASVAVDELGAHIRLGPFGWPRWTVELDQLDRADAVEIDPMAHGGWGYRITPGTRAVIIRSGPGMRLARTDEADYLVTVDDPEPGVALLNGYLRRAGRLQG